ncbi:MULTISPECIES: glycosyltransferase [Myroides]|uniref:N-acetylglucosaminyltransferase n=1 Tax=Myroides albus TaxID=2562892 RepID=A0A6I3LI03_9FLAO|nr:MULTISPECIES: glycosyltransferase [Myroides]MTG97477.1 glycosyltransferase [Myroides albus]MVX34669.1 glycosyltransferase [Myroides sp. LoEW2-1]UVD79508.1 glycosyltransferase [Myroides albus]
MRTLEPIQEKQQPTEKSFLDKIKNIFHEATLDRKDYMVLLLTFSAMIGASFLVFRLKPYFNKLHQERLNTVWGEIFLNSTYVLLCIQIAFLLFIIFLYIRYRAIKSVSDDELPTCTVIVPAYNEGKLVWQTLHSLADSNYPKEKLQIISLDDGSKDDTWQWMLKAKAELGDRIEIYQQPKNMGKRHALYRAFKIGSGDVFVTVDSDSIVREDTLRNLVSPFITNEKCGAVGGNVQVLNSKSAMIPRMLNVSFVFSFEFIRSAQSVLGSVLCTPGALAGYRREAVMNCLEDWINQTFMGQPSDIGEDRAMTNMILKQGYHVLFQQNAYVFTNTPEKYKNLYKMFIRWERSNVRENIMMSKFAFKNFREGSKIGPRILLLNQWIRVIMAYPLTIVMLLFIITHPILFVVSTLSGIFLFSTIQVFFYSKRYNILESFWAYPYSIFYTFTLFWITPYAIATASRRGWLTRG